MPKKAEAKRRGRNIGQRNKRRCKAVYCEVRKPNHVRKLMFTKALAV